MKDMRSKQTGFYALTMICLALLFLSACQKKEKIESVKPSESSATTSSTQELTTLPDVSVTDESGQQISLSDFQGKPLVILEWASWCQHCQRFLPIMETMYQEYKDEVQFVLINATGSAEGAETKEVAQAYLKENGFSFPTYYDEGLFVATILHIQSVPSLVVVDKNQKILARADQELTETEFRTLIETVIDQSE